MFRIALGLLLMIACSSKESAGEDELCARACKKLLSCAHASEKLEPCVHACTTPDKAQVEAIEAASCDQLSQGPAVPAAQ